MMKTWIALAASALALMPSPAVAQDDIEFVKRQIKLLEDAGIDASEMRESLKIMEADAAQAAARGAPASPVAAQTSGQSALAGRWVHPTKGTWTFGPGGNGTLVRESVNGIPGTYTITLRWEVEGTNTLVYTPTQNTLVGSPDSDRDEPIANPKTYRAPFEIVSGTLILGGAEYRRP
ncbi:MAG: hypothetical protein H2054_07395 [Sphingomonas sp.]|uniref:hypothetical protein n=1 Tax=Sphingomonas sp. TaxID=28214 RepID=UPI0017D9EE65|nr:hypothetical protein [Zymomonas sp.]MBA4772919.1 hypothetical protein [Sphingomonas sp.]